MRLVDRLLPCNIISTHTVCACLCVCGSACLELCVGTDLISQGRTHTYRLDIFLFHNKVSFFKHHLLIFFLAPLPPPVFLLSSLLSSSSSLPCQLLILVGNSFCSAPPTYPPPCIYLQNVSFKSLYLRRISFSSLLVHYTTLTCLPIICLIRSDTLFPKQKVVWKLFCLAYV